MEIKTIKYLLRKNLGNYEHAELSMEAVVSEGETNEQAILALMSLTKSALNDELSAETPAKAVAKSPEKVQTVKDSISGAEAQINYGGVEVPAVIEKAKRTRAAKTEVTTEAAPAPTPSEKPAGTSNVVGSVDTANVSHVQSETPKASAPVDKNVVVYDSKIKEHRSRFATYLGTTFPKWKPDTQFGVADSPAKAEYAEKVRVFSGNLHGKAFEDTKGNMLESFKAELEAFFGHTK